QRQQQPDRRDHQRHGQQAGGGEAQRGGHRPHDQRDAEAGGGAQRVVQPDRPPALEGPRAVGNQHRGRHGDRRPADADEEAAEVIVQYSAVNTTISAPTAASAPPGSITARRPLRSVSQPNGKENPNMPALCRASAIEMAVRSWPWYASARELT